MSSIQSCSYALHMHSSSLVLFTSAKMLSTSWTPMTYGEEISEVPKGFLKALRNRKVYLKDPPSTPLITYPRKEAWESFFSLGIPSSQIPWTEEV